MPIVPDQGQTNDTTGAQTIVAAEPDQLGLGPESLTYTPPDFLSGQMQATDPTAAAGDSSAGSALGSLTAPNTGSSLRDKIISMGMQYIGTPYVWGGTTPGGFDCSGLMQYIFGKAGVKLPRISYQQADYGKRINLDALQAGDLVAWNDSTRNAGADHIALYIGNGQILEAPHTGASVRVRTLTPGKGFDASAWGVSLSLPGDN